jgi:predicted PurR-regulated permease PerM
MAATDAPRHDTIATSEAPFRRAVFGSIVLGAVLVVLGLLATQLVTLLLAVMFTIIISLPIDAGASAFERRGLPRALGGLAALLAGIGVIAGLMALLVPKLIAQVNALINDTPAIVRGVEQRISQLTGERPGHIASQLQHYAQTYVRQPSHLVGPLATIGVSAATIVGGLIIAVMTAYYIGARPAPLVNGVLSMFPASRREYAARVMSRLRAAWLAWLRGLVIAMVIIGLLLWFALGVIVGLKYALSFAVLSAIAEVVPYLGALVSGIPPVAFALTISPGTAIAVLVIYIVVHQIEANIISPIVMSRSVHLHPVVIAIGVVAVGEVFGFLGLIIAVPILSTIVILGEEVWVRPLEWRSPIRKALSVRMGSPGPRDAARSAAPKSEVVRRSPGTDRDPDSE